MKAFLNYLNISVVAPFLLVFVAFAGHAHAGDGHELLARCKIVAEQSENSATTEVERIKAAQCIAYLSGFGGADALSPLTRNGRRLFCIPKSVSLSEAAVLTVRWMEQNPDKLQWGSHEVLAMANIVNFPCTEN